ncbi:hypothetical protein Bbelb_241990 [Branchiostoma belcheri]|nr:hypothetical protein Bbelb_241990 [Branchiostoma belcheri]
MFYVGAVARSHGACFKRSRSSPRSLLVFTALIVASPSSALSRRWYAPVPYHCRSDGAHGANGVLMALSSCSLRAPIALPSRSHRALITLSSSSHRAPMATLVLSPRSGQFQVAERAL